MAAGVGKLAFTVLWMVTVVGDNRADMRFVETRVNRVVDAVLSRITVLMRVPTSCLIIGS